MRSIKTGSLKMALAAMVMALPMVAMADQLDDNIQNVLNQNRNGMDKQLNNDVTDSNGNLVRVGTAPQTTSTPAPQATTTTPNGPTSAKWGAALSSQGIANGTPGTGSGAASSPSTTASTGSSAASTTGAKTAASSPSSSTQTPTTPPATTPTTPGTGLNIPNTNSLTDPVNNTLNNLTQSLGGALNLGSSGLSGGSGLTPDPLTSSSGNCKSLNAQWKQAQTTLAQTQTGGRNSPAVNNPNYKTLAEQNAESVLAQIKSSRCALSPDFALKTGGNQYGDIKTSEYTPPAPGEKNIVADPTYNTNFSASAFDNSNLPATSPSFKIPSFATASSAANPATTAPSAPAAPSCGAIASAYGAYLLSQTGAGKPAYKDGCAGSDTSNQPRTTPDNPTAVCTGTQFSSFGFVEAAYNNNAQSQSVSDLIGRSPANPGTTVAANDTKTGVKNEPNGCRLSNYQSCGQVGDIIMVQTQSGAADTAPYNQYLIYAGNGQFYQVSNNSTVISKSSLPPEYASMSYAAVRLGCSTTTSTASN